MSPIPVRLGLQQRVLPAYRAPFFEALAQACPQGLHVIAGQPQPHEGILPVQNLQSAQLASAANFHLGRVPRCVFWQRGMTRWLERSQPQTLIVEANPRNLSLPAAARWMHSRRRAVIGWGLGSPAASEPLRAFWKLFIHQFDALIAYSQRGAEDYAALGFPGEKIFIARNAAAARPAVPPPLRPPNYPDGRATLLFVGRLQARKRVDLLLQACSALPPGLQPRLLIVGDGPERAELEAQASSLYPAAEFLGAIQGTALDPVYAQADLFVLPGTGGLAVQQAMAHALPVIVAEADGTQQDLVRPGNGWNIPPGDLSALTATLQAAISNPIQLRMMGAESYRIVAEEINLETMVTAFERAVRAVYPSCTYL